jgi:hypothetical protein
VISRRRTVLRAACVLASACAEPLEFVDRTLPPAAETPVVDHAPVSIEQRTEKIALAADLTPGGDTNDPSRSL